MAFGNKEKLSFEEKMEKLDEKREKRDEKKAAKVYPKFGLEDVSAKYADAVGEIAASLSGNVMGEVGTALAGGKTEDIVKMTYLKALTQQNWILIRQMDEISKKLDKLIEK
ncbi:MAG: hypothetical protein EUB_03482 [Eubacterium sp.]|uniref:hypothetical protein n=1 Tax=Eubacterium sp. TaxID=142586 RepID=UPI00302171F6